MRTQHSQSYLQQLLTSGLQKQEDHDWLGIEPRLELKMLLAKIRQKKGFVSLQLANSAEEKDVLKKVGHLAKTALEVLPDQNEVQLPPYADVYIVQGGRLSCMT